MQSVRLAKDCLDSAWVPFGRWHRQCHLPSPSGVKSQSSICFMKNTASASDVPKGQAINEPTPAPSLLYRACSAWSVLYLAKTLRASSLNFSL
jgi:hypothetical protein